MTQSLSLSTRYATWSSRTSYSLSGTALSSVSCTHSLEVSLSSKKSHSTRKRKSRWKRCSFSSYTSASSWSLNAFTSWRSIWILSTLRATRHQITGSTNTYTCSGSCSSLWWCSGSPKVSRGAPHLRLTISTGTRAELGLLAKAWWKSIDKRMMRSLALGTRKA